MQSHHEVLKNQKFHKFYLVYDTPGLKAVTTTCGQVPGGAPAET
jgi:hypothetical protein